MGPLPLFYLLVICKTFISGNRKLQVWWPRNQLKMFSLVLQGTSRISCPSAPECKSIFIPKETNDIFKFYRNKKKKKLHKVDEIKSPVWYLRTHLFTIAGLMAMSIQQMSPYAGTTRWFGIPWTCMRPLWSQKERTYGTSKKVSWNKMKLEINCVVLSLLNVLHIPTDAFIYSIIIYSCHKTFIYCIFMLKCSLFFILLFIRYCHAIVFMVALLCWRSRI